MPINLLMLFLYCCSETSQSMSGPSICIPYFCFIFIFFPAPSRLMRQALELFVAVSHRLHFMLTAKTFPSSVPFDVEFMSVTWEEEEKLQPLALISM